MRRRDLLAGALAGVPLTGWPRVARAVAPSKKLLVIVANGGWDASIVFDPKPDSPGVSGGLPDENPDDPLDRETTKVFGGLTIGHNPVKRPHVAGFFDQWAEQSILVRGLYSGSLAHVPAMDHLLMGRGSADLVTTLASKDLAPLGAVDLGAISRPGPWPGRVSRLGTLGQISWLAHPGNEPPAAFGATDGGRIVIPSTTGALAAARQARLSRLGATWSSWETHHVEALADAAERADLLRSWDPERLPDATLRGDLAAVLDLLESGTASGGLVDSHGVWDTHADHGRVHLAFDNLFAALGDLMDELVARDLLDDVVVAVVSELGRTPWRNDEDGTDHWPWTSALLFGGGVVGNRALGATDEALQGESIDLASGMPDPAGVVLDTSALVGGLLQAVGLSDGGPALQLGPPS